MTRTAVELMGKPDGPEVFRPELGCKVGTFTQTHEKPCLSWHVPLELRGDFRPKDLANYKPEKDYRTDSYGKVLCYEKIKGRYCARKAINRYPRCSMHGGGLHPLDKVATEEDLTEREGMSRYKQFKAKLITVDDLDDEELAMCGFRTKNGSIYRPKNVPRELIQAFQRAIFDRATAELKSGVVESAKTLVRLATDPNVDDAIALRAAQDVLDRNLGKAPQTVSVSFESPWEEVFSGIAQVSREESRRARAIESSREAIESGEEPLDVESTPIDVEPPKDVPKKELSDLVRSRDEAIITPVLIAPSFDPSIVPDDFAEVMDEAAAEAEMLEGTDNPAWIDEVDWDD
jgi:hypothetical protein